MPAPGAWTSSTHASAVLPPLCRVVKRTVDVLVGAIGLVVMFPVLVVASVAIATESTGGVLFSQTRIGAGGRPFRILKLRTMRTGTGDAAHHAYVASLIAGDGGTHDGLYKIVHDDRRTRVGAFLRRFSIDELPQLWNVLRGEMSVIGPRPSLPDEVALYDATAHDRVAGKPGLTGLWQVSGRSRLSFQEMVELDARYWREWTLLLDLKILLRTPKAVLWNRDTA